MKTSQRGIDLIKEFEGFEERAYKDVVGYWTIGYGSLYVNGVRVSPGMRITREGAEEQLKSDVVRFEKAIEKLVTVDLNQNQFDALVSFTYNLGEGNLGKSTLLKKLNRGDFNGAADEFLKWNRAGGKVVNGLVRRRAAERELFLSGVEE